MRLRGPRWGMVEPGATAVETENLLRENNELLKQLLVEVKRIVREMQTMNEITRRRLPYKWVPGEAWAPGERGKPGKTG